VTKIKPDVSYYNQYLPTKNGNKKKGKGNVSTTTKGYQVDQFVVPDDESKNIEKNKSIKQIENKKLTSSHKAETILVQNDLKNNIENQIIAEIDNSGANSLSILKAKFEDTTTTADDMFKIADAIVDHQNDLNNKITNKEYIGVNNKEFIELIDDDLNEVIFIEKALDNLNQSLEVENKLQPEIEIIKTYMIKDKKVKKLYSEKFKEMKREIDEKNKQIEHLQKQLNDFNNLK
jgi:hypothetical protein